MKPGYKLLFSAIGLLLIFAVFSVVMRLRPQPDTGVDTTETSSADTVQQAEPEPPPPPARKPFVPTTLRLVFY